MTEDPHEVQDAAKHLGEHERPDELTDVFRHAPLGVVGDSWIERLLYPLIDLVSDSSERREDDLVRSDSSRRIFEPVMNESAGAGKDGAGLLRRVARGYHKIKRLIHIPLDVL